MTSGSWRRPAVAGLALAVALGVAACGAKPAENATDQGSGPLSTGTKGTRPGGALGAALGGAAIDDPNAPPPSDTGVPESTTTSAAPETTTTTAAPSTTRTTSAPVTQAPVTQAPVTNPPQQIPSGGPPPSLTASLGSQPSCPPGPATVQVTINWTGSNLNSVQISGPGVAKSGPPSGSASVDYSCHGTTRYNLAGSGSGGSASAYVDVVTS